jgi:hypothetical protein
MACRSLFSYCHELLPCLEAGGSLVTAVSATMYMLLNDF